MSKHLACLDGIAGDVLHELARPWKRFTVNIQSMVNPVPLAGSPCAHPVKSKSSSVAIDSYEPRAGRCNRPTDSYVLICLCICMRMYTHLYMYIYIYNIYIYTHIYIYILH